ncbi:ATP-binding protein [Geitlerinema sp. PCC 9228]|jgi:signal transduction histidine kinase|uniref:ATP-binding protein n=1 Tax=Geitlerinema sp. PCC 9228 TaxID=111611 RepID=UPI0008F9AD3F|nr:ATP-binding protein [Geitlerinema sp. PCC 9228]
MILHMLQSENLPQHLSDSVKNLGLESTVKELFLYDFQIELSQPGKKVEKAFENNPLLPGVILTEKGKYAFMLSRRRFFEIMSRPYGIELFSRRPLYSLRPFIPKDTLICSLDTQIIDVAKQCVQRSPECLYEPVVVTIQEGEYRLLDVHQLLLAQAYIQELTVQLLQEQTRNQMVQTEKMASLGQMVAGVAHELNNPINFISGNLQYLSSYVKDLVELISTYEKEEVEYSEELQELKEDIELDFLLEDTNKIVEGMQTGTDMMTKIVGTLRNFSRVDEGERRVADIHECIESTLLILRNRLKYHIQVEKNYGELPQIPCYSGQLSQVFMNLIVNASDALEDLRLKKKEEEGIYFEGWIGITTYQETKDDKQWIVIKIADNGGGIPQDIQERIFEMFFTTKPLGKGTGMGLAISYQIITDKHGGKLELHTEPDKGTEFVIKLPVEPPSQ